MRIQATAPGKNGTLTHDGVRKLTLTGENKIEHRKLKILLAELQNNTGFWTPIMFAAQEGALTKAEEKTLQKIVEKITPKFKKFCTALKVKPR